MDQQFKQTEISALTIYDTIILVPSAKVLEQKFSLYQKGSSLFRFYFVPRLSERQNKKKGENLPDTEKI